MPDTIPADIRAELDQTPEWWDREYRALVCCVFPPKPFDPAEHEGHDVLTIQTYAGRGVRQICTECGSDDE